MESDSKTKSKTKNVVTFGNNIFHEYKCEYTGSIGIEDFGDLLAGKLDNKKSCNRMPKKCSCISTLWLLIGYKCTCETTRVSVEKTETMLIKGSNGKFNEILQKQADDSCYEITIRTNKGNVARIYSSEKISYQDIINALKELKTLSIGKVDLNHSSLGGLYRPVIFQDDGDTIDEEAKTFHFKNGRISGDYESCVSKKFYLIFNEDIQAIQNNIAIKIQSHARGFLARLSVVKIRNNLEIKRHKTASLKIQSHVRGFLARKKIQQNSEVLSNGSIILGFVEMENNPVKEEVKQPLKKLSQKDRLIAKRENDARLLGFYGK